MPSCRRCGDVIESEFSLFCNSCDRKFMQEETQMQPKKRKNGISILEDKVRDRDARITELAIQVTDIITYLSLPKFAKETWVSKYDILRLLGRF